MPLPGRGRPKFNPPGTSKPAPQPSAPPPQPEPPAQDFRKPLYKKRKVIRVQAIPTMPSTTPTDSPASTRKGPCSM